MVRAMTGSVDHPEAVVFAFDQRLIRDRLTQGRLRPIPKHASIELQRLLTSWISQDR